MHNNIVIEVKNLKKSFKIVKDKYKNFILGLFFKKYEIKEVLKDVNFKIKEGEIVGYLGLNGNGKTTTIKILIGALYPDGGNVKVLGKNPFEKRKEILKKIGVVFGQGHNLFYEISVRGNFLFLKEVYRLSDEFFEKRLNYLLDMFDAKELLEKQYRTLSLGQKMKVNLIAALLHKPKILFLDEPTIGLDVFNKKRFREIIKRINKEENVTIFLTTHDMDDIEELANRIIVLNKGKIIFDGKIEDFKSKYSNWKDIIVYYKKIRNEKKYEEIKPSISEEKEDIIKLKVKNDQKELEKIIKNIIEAFEIKDLEVKIPTLEEIIQEFFNEV